MNAMQEDTICAIATAPGGAIGIVRVSGPKALNAVSGIFSPANGKSLLEQKNATVSFGTVNNGEEVIDEVLVSVFRAPHSYTGEDSVEISCHGSSYILQKVVELLIASGCRMAGPGEYTQRAFLNGKMDLSQAEAVADLIASSSMAEHRLAMNQMRGGFGNKLRELRDKLLHITSLMELELDFSDHEELEFADRRELKDLAEEIRKTISHLTDSFSKGNAIKNGVPVAIIGETNAGKSTLLNALLNEDKAIVSEIHGTTRDVIEDTVNIGGMLFRFIDTAGIRETTDEIESMGIVRTFKKLEQAEIVLWVIDMTECGQQWEQLKDKILPACENKHFILVLNKSDIAGKTDIPLPHSTGNIEKISISAKQKHNIDKLQKRLTDIAGMTSVSQNEIMVTNIRHYEALCHALDAIIRVQSGLNDNTPTDLVSQDLRECNHYLGSILGDISTDLVLQNIFSKFCIGK